MIFKKNNFLKVSLVLLVCFISGFLFGSYIMYKHFQPKLNKAMLANIVAVNIIDNWKEHARLEADKFQKAVKALTTECTTATEVCNVYSERVDEIKQLEDKNMSETYPLEMQFKDLVIQISNKE